MRPVEAVTHPLNVSLEEIDRLAPMLHLAGYPVYRLMEDVPEEVTVAASQVNPRPRWTQGAVLVFDGRVHDLAHTFGRYKVAMRKKKAPEAKQEQDAEAAGDGKRPTCPRHSFPVSCNEYHAHERDCVLPEARCMKCGMRHDEAVALGQA